jgi:hypothetical protein
MFLKAKFASALAVARIHIKHMSEWLTGKLGGFNV